MNKFIFLSVVAVLAISPAAHALYRSGTDHGYWWSTWYDDIGSLSISFDGAGTYPGAFQIRWSNVHNGGGGKGWQTGGYKTIGYNCSSLSGYVNFGIYGWTTNPLIEFYISDFGNHGGTNCGSLSSDGGTYTVYKQQRVNAPSIIGTATFWQYKSDRSGNQSLNSNHTITCGNHFDYWKSHCGSMGSFGEMKLNVEAFSSSNSATGQCYANVWESSGGSSTTTTTTSASTTTTTTSGGSTTTTTTSGGGSYYQMRNRNTGNCAGVNSSSNNADVLDLSCNGSSMRKWALQDAGSGYYYIVNQSTGKAMRASGSDVIQYTLSSGYWSEMFSREDVGDGYYTYKNRNTNTCLRATGGDIVLYSCNSGYWSEMFIRE